MLVLIPGNPGLSPLVNYTGTEHSLLSSPTREQQQLPVSDITKIMHAFVTASTAVMNVLGREEALLELLAAGPAACAVLTHCNFYPFTFFFRLVEQQLSCLYSPRPGPALPQGLSFHPSL